MSKKKKSLDEHISDVIDDIDYNSTELEDIQDEAKKLQEEINELKLLKKELAEQNLQLLKEIKKLKGDKIENRTPKSEFRGESK